MNLWNLYVYFLISFTLFCGYQNSEIVNEAPLYVLETTEKKLHSNWMKGKRVLMKKHDKNFTFFNLMQKRRNSMYFNKIKQKTRDRFLSMQINESKTFGWSTWKRCHQSKIDIIVLFEIYGQLFAGSTDVFA